MMSNVFNSQIDLVIVFIMLVAIVILVWGLYRAKPLGQLGILAWLQSMALAMPWVVFFSLLALGIYLNLAGILFLIVASATLYILLGKKIREGNRETWRSHQLFNNEESVDHPGKSGLEKSPEPSHDLRVSQSQTIPLAVQKKPIAPEDIKAIQGIFGIDTFFATESFPYQEGAIFKGNLRGDPQTVHTRLSARLAEQLGDRYRLFLVDSSEGRPVAVVLPSDNQPQPTTLAQKILAVILLLATIATSLEVGGIIQGFDLFASWHRWLEALPIAIGIWSILIVHELGHWFLAQRYQVRLSWPFFLPTWQIGSFGTLTRFESFLPNRKVLFDIAFAGPAASGLLSLGMLIAGLFLSHPGSLFQVPSEFFQSSLLVGTLAKSLLGSAMQQPLVDIHPLAIVGWLGLIITAINLMPAGQLDGGRITLAIYGRKIAGRATIVTLIVLAIASLVNPLALYWGLLIIFLQRELERPSLNEITEADDTRAALGIIALFVAIATLIPLTPTLARSLGIGP